MRIEVAGYSVDVPADWKVGFQEMPTHASQLIDAGVDIVSVSKRLEIYAHLFRRTTAKRQRRSMRRCRAARELLSRAPPVANGWQSSQMVSPERLLSR
jgi:hypothetical protein